MKINHLILTIVISILGCTISCNKGEINKISVKITQPKYNAKVVIGNNVIVSVVVNPQNSNIKNIKLYVFDSLIHTINNPPYTLKLPTTNFKLGELIIKATATEETGNICFTECVIEIIEYKPPSNIYDSRDGNNYDVIEIGNQVWMKENLRYKNELSLFVNNNDSYTKKYGYLYQTNVAIGEDICPKDYHIPTPNDWAILINYLGGNNEAGGNMKDEGTDSWDYPNNGATNSSGFTALPAGSLTYDSIPVSFGTSARLFTSEYGRYYFIDNDKKSINSIIYHPLNEYYSIRCVRDY